MIQVYSHATLVLTASGHFGAGARERLVTTLIKRTVARWTSPPLLSPKRDRPGDIERAPPWGGARLASRPRTRESAGSETGRDRPSHRVALTGARPGRPATCGSSCPACPTTCPWATS